MTGNLLGGLARAFHLVDALYTCVAILLTCAPVGFAAPATRPLTHEAATTSA